jgi:hypothetical protein
MGKILDRLRIILGNVYIALGATAVPVLIHAAYGMRQVDPGSYTLPVQGRVVSEETGEPVAGIRVVYDERYAAANTDGDGCFLVYVPEKNPYLPEEIIHQYHIAFFDHDGFENGGFFSTKYMTVFRDEIGDPLAVSLYRESQVAVIHGTVRSKGTGEPVSGIYVYILYRDGSSGESGYTPFSGFEVISDDDGQFSVQVPERDRYSIYFSDANGLFQWKEVIVGADEIKDSLKVDLEQTPGKDVE